MNGCMSVNDAGVYPDMGHGGRGRNMNTPTTRELSGEKRIAYSVRLSVG